MTADVWDEVGDAAGELLRTQLIDMVLAANSGASRSQQRHLGPSEIGDPCTFCLASKILGTYERDEFYDPWAAVIGTAVHSWLERAAERDNKYRDGAWCTEVRVMPDDDLLPKGGKADLFQDTTGTVVDHKVVSVQRQRDAKANGPGLTYRRQAHLYGLGFANANFEVKRVAIAFWIRGGRTSDLWVWSEPYSEAFAREALDRYRMLRELCSTAGTAILPSLPSDPKCWTCSKTQRSAA